jgi:hypothetical protein
MLTELAKLLPLNSDFKNGTNFVIFIISDPICGIFENKGTWKGQA